MILYVKFSKYYCSLRDPSAGGPSPSADLRGEAFGILFNVVETSQTFSLPDTVNEGRLNFDAFIGR